MVDGQVSGDYGYSVVSCGWWTNTCKKGDAYLPTPFPSYGVFLIVQLDVHPTWMISLLIILWWCSRLLKCTCSMFGWSFWVIFSGFNNILGTGHQTLRNCLVQGETYNNGRNQTIRCIFPVGLCWFPHASTLLLLGSFFFPCCFVRFLSALVELGNHNISKVDIHHCTEHPLMSSIYLCSNVYIIIYTWYRLSLCVCNDIIYEFVTPSV